MACNIPPPRVVQVSNFFIFAEALKLNIKDDHEDLNSTPHLNNLSTTRRVISTQKEAHDITTRFTQAAKGSAALMLPTRIAILTMGAALGTGQLIKDDFFTLFEAVGALEVRTSWLFGVQSRSWAKD